MTQNGYFLLADISGFTAYLTKVELEHAHEILVELLEYLASQTRPVLMFEKFAGDAVFAYAPEEKMVRGESLLEMLETTYGGFRDRLLSMSRRITCTCAACSHVTELDLKFLVHYGEYIIQQFGGHRELIGAAPLFVQKREWKEPIAQSTNWQGYAVFTETSLAHLGIHPDELHGNEFLFHSYRLFGFDLDDPYQAAKAMERHGVSIEEADATFELCLPISPIVLWAWLNEPQKRNQWYPSILKWSPHYRPGGRMMVGGINHCNHGVGNVVEEILDWRPYDYYSVKMEAKPGKLKLRMTIQLEPRSEGISCVHGRLWIETPRFLARPIASMTAHFLAKRMLRIADLT